MSRAGRSGQPISLMGLSWGAFPPGSGWMAASAGRLARHPQNGGLWMHSLREAAASTIETPVYGAPPQARACFNSRQALALLPANRMVATVAVVCGFMNILGIESSCDETGVALVPDQQDASDAAARPELLATRCTARSACIRLWRGRAELASRPHPPRRAPRPAGLPVVGESGWSRWTPSPSLRAGPRRALLVRGGCGLCPGAFAGQSLCLGCIAWRASALALPVRRSPEFPFVALLVSGGHTQLMAVHGVGATDAGQDHRRCGGRGV